jgi:archaellum biogenesis protein FlaJ (TadC family)
MYSMPLGTAIAAAAALLAVAGVFIAVILSSQKKHQATLDLLRYAVERGMTLDIELIDKIASADTPRMNTRVSRPGRGSRVAGILIIAYGVGFAIFAVFIGTISRSGLIPMLGVSALFICLGVGFLIVSSLLRREASEADPKA